MSSLSLSFLKDIKLEEIKSPAPRNVRKESNPPSGLTIRVWKDGSVYPSRELVDRFALEYPKATVTIIDVHNEDGSKKVDEKGNQVTKRTVTVDPEAVANGMDIFTLSQWLQAKSPNNKAILVGISPKSSPKVELFSNVKYNDDGTPQNSVMDQGASTFGKETFLPMIKEVYGVEPNEAGFIDLTVDDSYDLKAVCPNGVFELPKTIVRGVDKGKADYVRRENISIFGLVPVVADAPTQLTEEAPADMDVTATMLAESDMNMVESDQ